MTNAMRTYYREQEISIEMDSIELKGSLVIPDGATGIVLFAHGSGSNRFSSRNRHIAQLLQESRLATLLIDLLTNGEEKIDRHTKQYRFNIGSLAERLVNSTKWLQQNPSTKNLRIGYFGSSTGSAVALIAAADYPEAVSAIVSRGGRPDLAGSAVTRVKAPTLLIVGEKDRPVDEINRQAFYRLSAKKKMVFVPNATHLFEEPGALDEVGTLASQWFNRFFAP
ncbi:MAG: alpha/beta fold hydrolase [Cyanobacteria bacterium P01_G01_bin.19]